MNRFPRVGVIGAGPLARMMVAPATALGIDLLLFAADAGDSAAQICSHLIGDCSNLAEVLEFAKKCDVVTFEDANVPLSVVKGLEVEGIKVYPPSSALLYSRDELALREKLATLPDLNFMEESDEFDTEIAIMIARSPHGQATSWAPVEIVREAGICTMTVTPARGISSEVATNAQKIALEIAQVVGVVGMMATGFFIQGERIFLSKIWMHPDTSGLWSIEGSNTSQFEQHLRAILDLPLGSPAMNHKYVVTGIVFGGDKTDMYRPYLHLMARIPALYFHQYRRDVHPGLAVGHVSAGGDDLSHLTDEIQHARDYMSGTIDE